MKLTIDLHQNHLKIRLKNGFTLFKLWFKRLPAYKSAIPKKGNGNRKGRLVLSIITRPHINQLSSYLTCLSNTTSCLTSACISPQKSQTFPPIHCFLAKAHTNTNKKSYQSLTAKKVPVIYSSILFK